MCNNDGKVFIDEHGRDMYEVAQLREAQVRTIIATVADLDGKSVDEQQPRLSCTFPIGAARFQAAITPISPDGPVFAIRKRAPKVYTLVELEAQGVFTAAHVAIVRDLVKARQNIVVSGGTGSGKTTNVNAVLHEIEAQFPTHRIAILEDTYELQPSSDNHYRLLTASGITMRDLLFDTLRLRPDRIIVGEVRDGGTVLDLIDAWNSGHGGGATSVHADREDLALTKLERLAKRVLNANIREDISEAVNAVIQVGRLSNGNRKVLGIRTVTGYSREADRILTDQIAP